MELMILQGMNWFTRILYLLIGLTGVAAAFSAMRAQDEAFDFLNRQPKIVWVGLLALSSLMVIFRFPFLNWVGMVLIGLWWFDLRPSIRDLQTGTGY